MRNSPGVSRLGTSCLIGRPDALAIAPRPDQNFNDRLLSRWLEAVLAVFLIVAITPWAAAPCSTSRLAAELTKQGAGMAVGRDSFSSGQGDCALCSPPASCSPPQGGQPPMRGPARTNEGDRADRCHHACWRTVRCPYLVVPRVLALVIMARCKCMLLFCGRVWSGAAEQHLPCSRSRRTCSGTPVRTLDAAQ